MSSIVKAPWGPEVDGRRPLAQGWLTSRGQLLARRGVQHADRLGSIRAVTDGTGAVIASFRTDEFGVPTASTGSAGSPYRYTGEPLDASGLTYLRARHYDPSIGRFMTRDPFAGFGASPLSIPRVLRVAGSVVGDLAIEFEGGYRLETFRDHAILADREDWRFLMEDDDWVFEGGRLELVS